MEAAQDLQQRRLAGAVVAQEAQNLAAPQTQIDVAQGDDPAEPLADALDPDEVVDRLRTVLGHQPPPTVRRLVSRTLMNMVARIAAPRIMSKV